MSDIRLTREAEYLLCELYHAYTERRKKGMSRSEARHFGSSQRIHDEYIPKWTIEDIDDAAMELKEKGLMQFLWADITVYANAHLTDDGIVYMDHRFGDKFDDLAQRIASFRAAFFV